MEALQDRKTFEVNEVFTPSSPAIYCFVPRNEKINDRLVNALKIRGKQIVVYGHTGSGKTTLLLNKLRETYDNHITSRCMKTTTVETLLLDAFSQISPFYESEKNNIQKSIREISTEATFFEIKNNIKISKENEVGTKNTLLVPPQLNAHNLAKLLGERKLCWVIEDFHKVEESEKMKLSQLMKIFMDCGTDYPELKIIALGAAQTARQVVEYDDEMQNRVSEIEVQLMEENEIHKIIETGELRLNIEFPKNIKNTIAKFSRGIPAVCHQLCLNACNANGITETSNQLISITTENMKRAIETWIEETSDTLRNRFEKALKIKRKSVHHYEKIIIEKMIDTPDTGIGRLDLLKKIQSDYPNYTDASLKKTLIKLASQEGGEIIRYSHNSGLYCFSDPLYHAYATAFLHRNNQLEFNADELNLDLPTLVRLLEKEFEKRGIRRLSPSNTN